MMRRITGTACATAILMATQIGAVPVSAAPVDRPLADQLTRQFNQKELEQMQSGTGSYPQPSPGGSNRPPFNQPGPVTSPTGISRSAVPPPVESPYAPR